MASNKKQQADAAYLHAVDPNFAKTGFTLGDLSKLKTVTDISPYKGDDGSGNIVNDDITYQEDPLGRRVSFSPYQGVDNEGNQQGSPEYHQLTNIGGKQVQVTYDEKGNFKTAWGDDITKNGHKYTPIYNQKGNIIQYADAGGDGFGDFAKMVALSALTAGLGGAAGVGNSLFGLSGTAGQIAGGAALGAGRAALTGGDILRGALTGGIGGAGNVSLGDTGFSIGDVMKAVNVAKAIDNGDLMTALSGAASMAGGADIKIGDYTIGELAKNVSLAKSVLSGNPQAIIGALKNFAGTVQANSPINPDVVKVLTDAGMSKDDVANIDWASLYAQETTDPTTGQTIKGADLSQYANQNFGADPNANWNSYVKNVNNTIGNKGGMSSQWQKSGSDHIMIADDGSGIGINENGDSYALTQDQVTQMVKNGQLNTADSGYVTATGGTGNTPGGSGTKTTTTSTTKTTPTTPTATTPAALAAASWYGINPADLVKADKNDVAHIKSFKELFGHELYGDEQVPASSAQDHNISKDDILQALEDTQNYAGGGDIHALLQLLRS